MVKRIFQKKIIKNLNLKLYFMQINAVKHFYLTNILFIEGGLELDYYMD